MIYTKEQREEMKARGQMINLLIERIINKAPYEQVESGIQFTEDALSWHFKQDGHHTIVLGAELMILTPEEQKALEPYIANFS